MLIQIKAKGQEDATVSMPPNLQCAKKHSHTQTSAAEHSAACSGSHRLKKLSSEIPIKLNP